MLIKDREALIEKEKRNKIEQSSMRLLRPASSSNTSKFMD